VRVVLPGVVSIFGTDRDGMKDPKTLAGLHIKSTNVSFHTARTFGIGAGRMRGSNDHDIAGNNGCGMQANFSAERIDSLVIVEFQIHSTAGAEAGYNRSGFGIQSDQPVTRRHVENSFLGAIGPVSKSPSGKL